MALRRRRKNNFYHAYFWVWEVLPDGSLRRKSTTVNLYTTDLREAKALEAELMRKNAAVRNHQRVKARNIRMEIEAGVRPAEDLPEIKVEHRKRRLRCDHALEAAVKYREVGFTATKHWKNFVKNIGVKYMDEVTPELAFEYLCRRFPREDQGKSFVNCKSALNNIFRLTLLDAGLRESPFALIPNRALDGDHQRPFTEDEFKRMFAAAPEPWQSAILIAWHTGMRQKDVFTLKWDEIVGGWITKLPGKTSRFNRAVEVPVHRQLERRLAKLPRVNERVLGAWEYKPKNTSFSLFFGKFLDSLGICDDITGIVNFNSFRNSFITRMDAAGIPRHATRGIVGQVDDETTDLYSHDRTSASLILELPEVDLGENC